MHNWKPDVVLTDTYLPDGNGLEVCWKIYPSCPFVRILFFSAFCDQATVQAAVGGGASGYLQKTAAFN